MDTKINLKLEKRLIVKAPYNEEFIEGAKDLNGIWNFHEKVWIFNAEEEENVKELLEEVFEDYKGEDDYELTL